MITSKMYKTEVAQLQHFGMSANVLSSKVLDEKIGRLFCLLWKCYGVAMSQLV